MKNQVYNWYVKQGNMVIRRDEDSVFFQLDFEGADCCLLTDSDTAELIDLLTEVARQIWENPAYEKQPYAGPIYRTVDNTYSWQIGDSELLIRYNENEQAVEIRCTGNTALHLEVNYAVEIIQILEHLNR